VGPPPYYLRVFNPTSYGDLLSMDPAIPGVAYSIPLWPYRKTWAVLIARLVAHSNTSLYVLPALTFSTVYFRSSERSGTFFPLQRTAWSF
jgi:hypothetical protein